MKRTDITDLFPDATKEQIDKLMSINGADVNGAKGELEQIRTQLTTAQSELEKLTGEGGQADQLRAAKEALTTLRTELDTMKAAETLRVMREKVAADKAVPITLLTGTTEEECTTQADAILAFARPDGYPEVKDGGEAGHHQTKATRDRFADWAKDNL